MDGTRKLAEQIVKNYPSDAAVEITWSKGQATDRLPSIKALQTICQDWLATNPPEEEEISPS
jgi:hypothetical protein